MPKIETVLAQGGTSPLGASVPVRVAWKGMRTFTQDEDEERYYSTRRMEPSDIALIEVDFTSLDAGKISVNRIAFRSTDAGTQAMEWVFQKADEVATSIARENQASKYAWLNKRTLDLSDFNPKEARWIVSEDKGTDLRILWAALQFPLISAKALRYTWHWGDRRKLFWKGSPLYVAQCLGGPNDDDPYDGQGWNPPSMPPDRMVIVTWEVPYWRFDLVPLWMRKPTKEPQQHPAGLISSFPPNLRHICGVQVEYYSDAYGGRVIWNRSHPLIRQIDASGWDWCSDNFGPSLDPLPVKGALLSHKGRAASWVIRCLLADKQELWNGLLERDPNFLTDLWNVLSLPSVQTSPGTAGSVFQLVQSMSDYRLRELSPKGWLPDRWPYAKDKVNELLQKVGPGWTLEVRRS